MVSSQYYNSKYYPTDPVEKAKEGYVKNAMWGKDVPSKAYRSDELVIDIAVGKDRPANEVGEVVLDDAITITRLFADTGAAEPCDLEGTTIITLRQLGRSIGVEIPK